jgi:hypothetical protein
MRTGSTTGTFNQMTMPIQSGIAYGIRAVIPYKLHNATNGIRVGMLFPAVRNAVISVVADTGAALTQTFLRQGGNSVLVTSGTLSGRNLLFDGHILCSGSGNLMLFSANEGNSGTTVVQEGAYIVVWTLGPMAV